MVSGAKTAAQIRDPGLIRHFGHVSGLRLVASGNLAAAVLLQMK